MGSLHLWHQISTGKQCPEIVTSVIEIPKGSRSKFEVDKESGLIKLDRFLHGSMHYPVNYGIIPKTLGEDGDPLDILVFTGAELFPGCLVDARVIGVLRMVDQGVADDKILAVANQDVTLAHLKSTDDLSQHEKRELEHFFERYTELEQKEVTVPGMDDAKKAKELIVSCMDRYARKFGKSNS
jgi:inorganic pyrophosphatase